MFNHPFALELAYIAVEESIRLGASYADARYELRHHEEVATRDGGVVRAANKFERGLGVRVMVRGAWGFVGVSEPTRHDVTVAARRAVELARAASILLAQPASLAQQVPHRSIFRTQIKRDPLAVPLEDKVALLLGVDERVRGVKGVVLSEGRFQALRRRKVFVNSEGSELDQELVSTGLGFQVGATDGDQMQIRSFPGGRPGLLCGQGWEAIGDLPLLEEAEKAAESVVALTQAEQCPTQTGSIIVAGDVLAHQLMHMGCNLFGLDRVIGLTGGQSKGGFLPMDGAGAFELGSSQVSIYADAEEPGGVGSYGFDDEGVEGQRVDLVIEGKLTGYLCGRETAQRVGLEHSHGTLRAPGWSSPPTAYPSNVILTPQEEGDLDALIADTKDGILFESPRTFAADQDGESFLMTTEMAWRIKNGKKAQLLKNPTYRGRTIDFWKGCDALTGESEWAQYGSWVTPLRPDAYPVPVGAAAAPARFREVSSAPLNMRPPASEPTVPVVSGPKTETRAPKKRTSKTKGSKKTSKRKVRKKDTK